MRRRRAAQPPAGTITVLAQVRRSGISPGRLRRIIAHVLRRERAPHRAALTVALVSDPRIRALNRRFLGADRATDVLAFPADGAAYLGDVVVSVDRARVQARAAGHAVSTEVVLLAAHGVLHLLGHDDATGAARAVMMRRQRALLSEVGVQVKG